MKCNVCGETRFFDIGSNCSNPTLRTGEIPKVGMKVLKVWEDKVYTIIELIDEVSSRVTNEINIPEEGTVTFNNNLKLIE